MQHKLNKAINALHRKSLANGLEYGAEEVGTGGSRSPWQSLPRTDSPAPMKGEIVMLSCLYVSYMIPLVGWCASPEEVARRQVAAAVVFNPCHPQLIIRLNLSFLLIIWVYLMLGEPWPQMNQQCSRSPKGGQLCK